MIHHFDHTAKTFRRLLWSKKFSPYCGENLGGVKRHLWLGADTAGGVGGGGVMGCGKISRPANCPAPDQKTGIVPGFLDPRIRLFCPRGGAPDYPSRGRATGRFLRQPLSQRPEFSIVNLYSVR